MSLDNESFSSPKSLNTFLRVLAAGKGLVLSDLSYHDVRRLVDIEDETVTAKEDTEDELGGALVEACEELEAEERVGSSIVSVEPLQSVAALFDVGEAKALKARCLLAMHTRRDGSLSICGVLVCCSFTPAEALSTTRFTPGYCRQHSLPRLDGSTLLVDVVASSGNPQGVGTLLVLASYLVASRSRRYDRVATIALTSKGKKLFEELGWERHNYRDGTPRSLFWIDVGELQAQDVQRRLRWPDSVQSTCWRPGASRATAQKRYARCT